MTVKSEQSPKEESPKEEAPKAEISTSKRKTSTSAVNKKSASSLVNKLVKELTSDPEQALSLVQTLSMITKPWEALNSNGEPTNAMTVPSNQSVKEFRNTMRGNYVSGYKVTTIFGDQVALVTKDTPKWRVLINGEYQPDAPFIEHSQKAEARVREFVEERLKALG